MRAAAGDLLLVTTTDGGHGHKQQWRRRRIRWGSRARGEASATANTRSASTTRSKRMGATERAARRGRMGGHTGRWRRRRHGIQARGDSHGEQRIWNRQRQEPMRWGWRCRRWRRRRRSFWNGLGVRVSGVPGSEGVWRASSSTGEAKKLDPARLPQRSRARQKNIGSATDACRRGSFV
jgi:hypothetical protein